MLRFAALVRPEQRAWALYDWANSAFYTTVVTAVFPLYFGAVACAGVPAARAHKRLLVATILALSAAALCAPLLGALADRRGWRKRLLAVCTAVGSLATLGLATVGEGDWKLAAALFALAQFSVALAFVFYDALLPHVARREELDGVSSAAYALGYLGGGLLLCANLAWIQRPEWFGLPHGPELDAEQRSLPARLAFLSVGLWWAGFSIPLFRRVREPRADVNAVAPSGWRAPLRELRATLRELAALPQALRLLAAFLIYNDGVVTIMRMAAPFAQSRGVGQGAIIGGLVLVQFIGWPCSYAFGRVASRIGAKASILCALSAYAFACVLAFRMQHELHFYALAALVGAVQGGCQALSRSLYSSMLPSQLSARGFAFFAVSEKFAGIVGPLLWLLALELTGSDRAAILSLILCFAAGGWLLARVDVEAGRASARAAEEREGYAPEPLGARA
jgi:UMF1 family MFS transporter